ncbi:hypothetical protein BKA58DRAFT_444957 [Alternaria rosae]|uniref:uncharacterized protein n=1 Tax=Alternaria rosae TaxID=1187941 RepID=UPI001E8E8A49|nr:uncharacterized protein BKA58DRAFT_444957 [Alternaria rosae]KAH6851448.1 hypothetical protein BKA58DRAFT_444957 [Alternaria rosae]
MIPPTTFTCFPDLAPELQVMIINHALEEDMAQRKNKLVLHLHSNDPRRVNHTGNPPTSIAPCSIQLPRLPALYYTDRLFRGEALRTQPLQQLFMGDEPTTPDTLGALLIFDADRDTVVIEISKCCLKNPYNMWRLFAIMEPLYQPSVTRVIDIVVQPIALPLGVYRKFLADASRVRRHAGFLLVTDKVEVGTWHLFLYPRSSSPG